MNMSSNIHSYDKKLYELIKNDSINVKTRTQNVVFRNLIYEQAENCYNVLDEYKNKTNEELKNIQENSKLPYQVMLFNLNGDLNISSMIRTSLLSGAESIWVYGRRRFDRRGLVGADKYININVINGFEGESINYDLNKLEYILNAFNLFPIYGEHGGIELHKFDWKANLAKIYSLNKKPIIIMGNESKGFDEKTMNFFDSFGSYRISVPQKGVLRSYNVGHALSIILWDMRRQMEWF